jgi:uncharacterized protein (TIGR03435 family)
MRNQPAYALLLATALLLPSLAAAQVPTAVDEFHISPPNTEVLRLVEDNRDAIAAAHITLLDLIRLQYPQYAPDHIIGLTPQQRSTRFNIVAKIDPPGVRDPEHDPHARIFMIDALLKNHFHLVVHETDKPYEQLIAVANGTKPAPCPPSESYSTTLNSAPAPTGCITMDEFATRLSNPLHIQVINATDLTGTFALAFNWSLLGLVPHPSRGHLPFLPPALLTSLQTNLGLTLVPVPANRSKTLVVDHAELPTILEQTGAATAEH